MHSLKLEIKEIEKIQEEVEDDGESQMNDVVA